MHQQQTYWQPGGNSWVSGVTQILLLEYGQYWTLGLSHGKNYWVFLFLHNPNTWTKVFLRVNKKTWRTFLMCLFHFSTCFEKPSAHHQENQLYQYIIWYISLCVGGRLLCRSLTCTPDGHLHRVIYTRWCIDTIDSPDDEHWVARNMYRNEINTLKKCVKLVINTNKFFNLPHNVFILFL